MVATGHKGSPGWAASPVAVQAQSAAEAAIGSGVAAILQIKKQ